MEFAATDLIALFWLVAMEIVLGIDNIVFITILTARLPAEKQKLGRRVGLILALVTRILLLGTLFFFLGMSEPVFSWTDLGVPESWFESAEATEHIEADAGGDDHSEEESSKGHVTHNDPNEVSIRDIILFIGGLFLLAKSVYEIHEQINEDHEAAKKASKTASFTSVVIQIAIIDIVFSLDSVITAVGMADHLIVMVIAVIAAVLVMLAFSEVVAKFVEKHPTVKMLALSFLILIGSMLVAESVGAHLDKSLIYFAMAFALMVELLNLKVRSGSHGKEEATE